MIYINIDFKKVSKVSALFIVVYLVLIVGQIQMNGLFVFIGLYYFPINLFCWYLRSHITLLKWCNQNHFCLYIVFIHKILIKRYVNFFDNLKKVIE